MEKGYIAKGYIRKGDFYCIGKDWYYYDSKTYIEDEDNEDEEDN